jgi:hypothetical protein
MPLSTRFSGKRGRCQQRVGSCSISRGSCDLSASTDVEVHRSPALPPRKTIANGNNGSTGDGAPSLRRLTLDVGGSPSPESEQLCQGRFSRGGFAGAQAIPKSAGQDGPLLYPGPLCGGEAGTTGRAAGVDREVDSFSPGQESGRKARPRLTDLPGRRPGERQAGCRFLLGTSLLDKQKRSTSPSEGGRKLLPWIPKCRRHPVT